MSRSKISFFLGQGSVVGAQTNDDGISSFQFYGTAPGTFATTPTQVVYSLKQAITAGITNTHVGETAATGSIAISAKGNTGDGISVAIAVPVPVSQTYPTGKQTINIANYVVASADTTAALQGIGLAASINALTYKNGFTATSTSPNQIATYALNAPGTVYAIGDTGTISGGTGGTYTVASITKGTGATISFTASGGAITLPTVSAGGTGFNIGDKLPVTGGTGGVVVVLTVSAGGVITGLTMTGGSGGSGYTTPGSPVAVTPTTGIVSGITITPGTGYTATTGAATTATTGIGTGLTINILSVGTTATITITAAPGLGIALNTGTPLSATASGALTLCTITQFSGGVYSPCDIWYYHVSRFFTANPNGQLWINFTASPTTNFAEVMTLINAAGGVPRMVAVFDPTAKTVSQVTSAINQLQGQFTASFAAYTPCDIFYVPNIAGVSNIATLQNLQTYGTAQNVTPIISQDGGAAGAQLYLNSGISISNIGDIMGLASTLAVSQDIGEIGVGNISDGTENNIPALTNGVLISTLLQGSQLDTLDEYRYLFCVNEPGYPGTFINNDWTAIVASNSYNRLSVNRTINKVLRGQYIALLPLLKSRIYLNDAGTIDTVTLQKYYTAAQPQIVSMVNNGDLSPGNLTGTALTDGVVSIDPTQNVKTQGYIAIVYNLLPVYIADNIQVTLQFTQKL
jgi:hypothetical protein